MDLKKYDGECMDWIYLAQDRDKWWAVVNTVTDHSVLYNAGCFCLAEER
jgi:hypothetical protein